jgi:hypothetical protein
MNERTRITGAIILTGENRCTWRNTCPSATLSTTSVTWTDVGLNAGLCEERTETYRLSHDTSLYYFSVREKRVESRSLLLPLESQIDTIGSNATDNGEIGNHSITMLSTVNYRLNRFTTLVPSECHECPVIWAVARELADNLQRHERTLGGLTG